MFYAVKKGKKRGIYDNWSDAQKSVKGFSEADYKKFETEEQARAYLDGRDLSEEKILKSLKKGYLVVFVKGNFNETTKECSYGNVFILPNNRVEKKSGSTVINEYFKDKNIMGEVFGVIEALEWAEKNNYKNVEIYYSYDGIYNWVSGRWNAKNEISRIYKEKYNQKFANFDHIIFSKMSAIENKYSKEASTLAKMSVNQKRITSQGGTWISIPYIDEEELTSFMNIVSENDKNIKIEKNDNQNKIIYKCSLGSDKVVITLFKEGKNTLLLQGRESYLFQNITSFLVEFYGEKFEMEDIFEKAYEMKIDKNVIDNSYSKIESLLPQDYPKGIKCLIKQSIINLNYYIESNDYSQYCYSALRALEGHIKYLLNKVTGQNLKRRYGSLFNKNNNGYYLSKKIQNINSDVQERVKKVEECYNYYKNKRDTLFHFGDIVQDSDNTRTMKEKYMADEIIKKCINLITG